MLYSGSDKKHEYGVGIIIEKSVCGSLIDWKPISNRIITARFAGQGFNVSIVQVYLPTTGHTDQEIEEFYEKLQYVYDKLPKRDIKIIMGDFNASVGKKSDDIWKNVHGQQGYGNPNERGERLLQFCQLNGFCIMNTFFQHKNSRKWTIMNPGNTPNMIDYILIERRWRSAVSNARSFPSASIGSDHNMLLSEIKLRFNVGKKKQKQKIDIEKLLTNKETKMEYQIELKNRFNCLLDTIDNLDIDEAVEKTNEIYKNVASEILGHIKPKKSIWISDKVIQLADERRKIKKTLNNRQSQKSAYNSVTREIRKEVENSRVEWINKQCEKIEQLSARNDMRGLYGKVNELKTGVTLKERSNVIKDRDGKLLTTEKEVSKGWSEYCGELYNHNINVNQDVLNHLWPNECQEEIPNIMECEVEAAITKLKSRKAPGVDELEGEDWAANHQ